MVVESLWTGAGRPVRARVPLACDSAALAGASSGVMFGRFVLIALLIVVLSVVFGAFVALAFGRER
jgi:hypothetical protein